MEKRKFETALELTLKEMHAVDEDMCCAIYWDDMSLDNAIVMFMEYPYYGNMHSVMRDLHERLSNRMGHPVAICHNHPTDESVLIHSDPCDARVYYSDECCKRGVLTGYPTWVITGRDCYRPEYQSLYKAAECLAEGMNKSPAYILQCLDWDKDPQAQLIQLLIDYHG